MQSDGPKINSNPYGYLGKMESTSNSDQLNISARKESPLNSSNDVSGVYNRNIFNVQSLSYKIVYSKSCIPFYFILIFISCFSFFYSIVTYLFLLGKTVYNY